MEFCPLKQTAVLWFKTIKWLFAIVLLWETKNIFPPAQVDGVRFFLTEEGIQLVVIDGHHGKVVDRATFKNSILQGIPAQIENYVNNIKDQWVNNLFSLRCNVQECCMTLIFFLDFITQHGPDTQQQSNTPNVFLCLMTPKEPKKEISPKEKGVQDMQAAGGCTLFDSGTDWAPANLQGSMWLINCRATFMLWVIDQLQA